MGVLVPKGLGFRVQGLGFRDQGLGIWGVGTGGESMGWRVWVPSTSTSIAAAVLASATTESLRILFCKCAGSIAPAMAAASKDRRSRPFPFAPRSASRCGAGEAGALWHVICDSKDELRLADPTAGGPTHAVAESTGKQNVSEIWIEPSRTTVQRKRAADSVGGKGAGIT